MTEWLFFHDDDDEWGPREAAGQFEEPPAEDVEEDDFPTDRTEKVVFYGFFVPLFALAEAHLDALRNPQLLLYLLEMSKLRWSTEQRAQILRDLLVENKALRSPDIGDDDPVIRANLSALHALGMKPRRYCFLLKKWLDIAQHRAVRYASGADPSEGPGTVSSSVAKGIWRALRFGAAEKYVGELTKESLKALSFFAVLATAGWYVGLPPSWPIFLFALLIYPGLLLAGVVLSLRRAIWIGTSPFLAFAVVQPIVVFSYDWWTRFKATDLHEALVSPLSVGAVLLVFVLLSTLRIIEVKTRKGDESLSKVIVLEHCLSAIVTPLGIVFFSERFLGGGGYVTIALLLADLAMSGYHETLLRESPFVRAPFPRLPLQIRIVLDLFLAVTVGVMPEFIGGVAHVSPGIFFAFFVQFLVFFGMLSVVAIIRRLLSVVVRPFILLDGVVEELFEARARAGITVKRLLEETVQLRSYPVVTAASLTHPVDPRDDRSNSWSLPRKGGAE